MQSRDEFKTPSASMHLLLFDRRMPALILTRGRLILRLVYVRVWEYLYLGACTYVLTRDRSLGGGIACVYACFYFYQKQLCGSSRIIADRHILRFGCVRYYFGCIRACAVCLIWIGMWVRARNSIPAGLPNKTIFQDQLKQFTSQGSCFADY